LSRGIGANAYIAYQDNEIITYAYGGYNLNKVELRNKEQIKDGLIIIKRECFDKWTVGETYRMCVEGLIKVKNCSNCWWITNDDLKIDMMTLYVLYKIFITYETENSIPQKVSYDV